MFLLQDNELNEARDRFTADGITSSAGPSPALLTHGAVGDTSVPKTSPILWLCPPRPPYRAPTCLRQAGSRLVAPARPRDGGRGQHEAAGAQSQHRHGVGPGTAVPVTFFPASYGAAARKSSWLLGLPKVLLERGKIGVGGGRKHQELPSKHGCDRLDAGFGMDDVGKPR